MTPITKYVVGYCIMSKTNFTQLPILVVLQWAKVSPNVYVLVK